MQRLFQSASLVVPGKFSPTRLNFDDGQEGNQFSQIDSQLPLLGLWRWRRLAGRLVGTLRLESVLRNLAQFVSAIADE